MKTKLTLPVVCLVVLALAFTAFVWMSSATLPAKVATHFGFSGNANGWMSRSSHVTGMICLGLGMSAFLVLVFSLVGFVPATKINMPNKDYWLTPERKPDSAAFFQRQGIWLACVSLIFTGLTHEGIVRANLLTPPKLDNSLMGLGTAFMLGGTAFFVVRLILRFARKPAEG